MSKIIMSAGLLVLCSTVGALEAGDAEKADYLRACGAYAHAMIERGRDTYGEEHSPLFAATLNRNTHKLENIGPGPEGIRSGDRTTYGANPMHDLNLYQILYSFSEITGDRRYSEEADRALSFFFENCQNQRTGLMAWGEHLGWDFHRDAVKPKGRGRNRTLIHEFYGPWVLWDRCFELAPEACEKFAKGLWQYQIYDKETGQFSRHATWDEGPHGAKSEFPRHAGFYIETWAKAYEQTRDPEFLKYIDTMLNFFTSHRQPLTMLLPCDSEHPYRAWPESELSLAISLGSSAHRVRVNMRKKIREFAAASDRAFSNVKNDLSPDGKGFVACADTKTGDQWDAQPHPWPRPKPFAAAYGQTSEANRAMLCYLRYQQLEEGDAKQMYTKLALGSADRYLRRDPDPDATVFPGVMGDVIYLLVSAYELTDDRKYLNRADHFAEFALQKLFGEESALPKASSRLSHYEAITRADTLMMALLQLWQVENRPGLKLHLIYTDR